jgi:hypothetical protein
MLNYSIHPESHFCQTSGVTPWLFAVGSMIGHRPGPVTIDYSLVTDL